MGSPTDIDVEKLKIEYEKLKDENKSLKKTIDELKKEVNFSLKNIYNNHFIFDLKFSFIYSWRH